MSDINSSIATVNVSEPLNAMRKVN
jgi:hypothetical protein